MMRRHGKHRTGVPVAALRLRLHLERLLPPGMPPTEANMLQFYGVAP